MKALVLSIAAVAASWSQAQESSQPDYSGSKDQLKPSQVNYQGEVANPANASGVFVGGGVSFGQASPTDAGSPGLASLFHIVPGYQVARGSWGRIEFGADVFSGKLSLRHANNSAETGGKISLPIGLGFVPQFGYGYSLGEKMFGVLRVGVGPVMAKMELGDLKSSGSLSGLSGMLGWDLIAPVADRIDFTAGLAWSHWQFDIDQLDAPDGSKIKYNRALQVNSNEVKLGLRWRL